MMDERPMGITLNNMNVITILIVIFNDEWIQDWLGRLQELGK